MLPLLGQAAGLLRDALARRDELVARGLSDALAAPSSRFTMAEQQAIQIVVCVLSGISFIGAIVTFYWFSRMQRNFRHTLIVLLIFADVFRSVWLFVFGLVSLASGPIATTASFCQASGFFYQVGLLQADYAVLAIAVHTALQIFNPNVSRFAKRIDQSGLFRYRYAVYIILAVVPCVVSSLGFIQGRYAYVSQGPYCSLPIRPIWYRLALNWIPRYVIMLLILALYIAIYVHVALQFRTIKWLRRLQPESSNPSTMEGSRVRSTHNAELVSNATAQLEKPAATRSPLWGSRRFSSGATLIDDPNTIESTKPDPEKDRTAPLSDSITPAPYESMNFVTTSDVATGPGTPMKPIGPSAAPANPIEADLTREERKKRQHAVQRQVRGLFIYPTFYFIMWLLPFVQHLCNYNDHLAQNPIFALALLSVLSVSLMGIVDCLIFSIREKPWKHIPSSDGTFLGSFVFWKDNRYSGRQSMQPEDAAPYLAKQDTPPPTEPAPDQQVAQDQGADAGEASKDKVPATLQRPQLGSRTRTWDFATSHQRQRLAAATAEDGQHQPSRPPVSERYWFDRRLSAAVG